MGVTFDKLLGKLLLHDHKAEDVTDGDSTWVNVAGDTMEGDLVFPTTGFLMDDGTNQWRVTINTDGALVTTMIVPTGIGVMVIGTDFTIT